MKQNKLGARLVWEKSATGGLIPIFVCQNKNYTLKNFIRMKAEDRIKLIASITKTIYTFPEGVAVDARVMKIIENNEGEMITSSKPYQFAMSCAALTAPIRKILKLDRLGLFIAKVYEGHLRYVRLRIFLVCYG